LIVWNHHPLCADTARVTVVVDFDVEIMIPNVLTPNGDGQNDAFAITTRGVTMAALEVHNRWGNVVLSTGEKALQDGINNLWRPEGLSDGVYFYTLQYADAFGRRRTRSGHITLLK
jgi:gliding motility-associated-like protein